MDRRSCTAGRSLGLLLPCLLHYSCRSLERATALRGAGGAPTCTNHHRSIAPADATSAASSMAPLVLIYTRGETQCPNEVSSYDEV